MTTRTTSELQSGDIFAGRYRIQKRIGKGGMGTVYKAVDTFLEVTVALKTINIDITNDERTVKRLKREVILARKVAHPNACRIYDIGEADGVHYVSMEYVEGNTLADILKEKGMISPSEGVTIIKQVLMALGEAHRAGVIHRDLKPQNIMVDINDRAFIMDFGISISEDAHRLTETGMLIGTPRYMAPEQFGNRNVDHRADLYSIGIIMFEMFTGRLPFEANTPAAVMFAHLYTAPPNPSVYVPGFPHSLDAVVAKTLDKEPQNRYANAQELIQALEKAEQKMEAAITDGTTESFTSTQETTVSSRSPSATQPSQKDFPSSAAGEKAQHQAHVAADAAQPTIPQVHKESRKMWWIAGAAIIAVFAISVFVFGPSRTENPPGTSADSSVKQGTDSGSKTEAKPPETGASQKQTETNVSKIPETTGEKKVEPVVQNTVPETQVTEKQINLQTNPPGASIFVDGRDTGQKTPDSISVEQGGKHDVELRLDGYEPVRQRIDMNSPEQIPLRLVAIKLTPGKVSYEGSVPVSIYNGNSLLFDSKQGSSGELKPGTYTLTLISREKAVVRDIRTVQVKSGETTVLKEPAMGKLTITAVPGNCKILIDSDYQDAAPIFNLPVQAGSHSIKVEWSRLGKEKTFSIDIPAGETRVVRALASDKEVEVVEENSR